MIFGTKMWCGVLDKAVRDPKEYGKNRRGWGGKVDLTPTSSAEGKYGREGGLCVEIT